ncbi:lactate racemase domain-containing protein, partial [Candidatus Zixiibacteriota bacterium]
MELLYDNQKLNLDLPSSIRVETYSPGQADYPVTYDDFASACQKSNISTFLKDDSVLFIVNDAHRNTPTPQILEWFEKCIPGLLSKISFLVACGTHEPPTNEEYRKIFGNLYESVKERVSYHDCHNYDTLTKIGIDKFGEEVWINKKVLEHKKLFTINSVEPHYFAGYTGGRKSFFPGLADFKTIERNHNLANSLDCAPLKIKGNPMAEHLNNLLDILD